MEREDIYTKSFSFTKLQEGAFTIYENIQTTMDIDKVLATYRDDRKLPEDTPSLIDQLLTRAKSQKRKEKLATHKIAQYFIEKYEETIGRKIYNTIK